MGNVCGATLPLDSFPPVMSPLGEADRELVISTWPTIYKHRHKIGVHVYNSFLSSEKDMRVHFPKLTKSESGSDRTSQDQTALIRHAVAVMEGFGVAVDCLRDQTSLDAFLGSLGDKHYSAGVPCDTLQKLYPAFSNGLAVTLEAEYTHPVKLAWKRFFFYMISVMKVAMIQRDLIDRWDSKDLDTPISGCFNTLISSASGGQRRSSKSDANDSCDISGFKTVVE